MLVVINKRFVIASFVMSTSMAAMPLSFGPPGIGCKPSIELFTHVIISYVKLLKQKKVFTKENTSTPTGLA